MECKICGEILDLDDETQVGLGAFAEMYDPENPEERGGMVHTECGVAKGWEVA